MPKIDLITFEKIKDVIDIDTITDHRSMVEKYVISPAIEEYLVELCQDFNRNVHKAVQVVGGMVPANHTYWLLLSLSLLNRSYVNIFRTIR